MFVVSVYYSAQGHFHLHEASIICVYGGKGVAAAHGKSLIKYLSLLKSHTVPQAHHLKRSSTSLSPLRGTAANQIAQIHPLIAMTLTPLSGSGLSGLQDTGHLRGIWGKSFC